MATSVAMEQREVSAAAVSTHQPNAMHNTLAKAAAASGGALFTSLFVTPLDVAKVRLQSQLSANDCRPSTLMTSAAEHCRCTRYRCPCNRVVTRPVEHRISRQRVLSCKNISGASASVRLQGTSHALRHIFQTEGVKGLFSGLSPTMMIAVPATVLYYVSYDMLMHVGRDHAPEYEAALPLIAGSSARVFAASVTSPLELIRTRMQSGNLANRGMVVMLSQVFRSGGSGALLSGLGATLARDVPFSAIYWTAFETSQRHVRETELSRGQRAFVCGALSGAIAATVTTPFDVVKTLQQVQATKEGASIASILRDIVQRRGVAGLFTGLGARLARVAPSCAIMISCYELGKEKLGVA
ncbi:hypothetical protein Poli38472_012807 [Pythium oligandrum]|uniref:Mitochondrial carrier protein n=1 Tax=Pythium oligandrum TaxID=41045 RepID=A0A8K1FHR8_PYTOL|nr:hypothetical protein Poli38472_012807 [Pythium oligandrum]|eukprot:TMW64185.1 hypothetical protein Poli38472_012807 [Pythium oligandrum]